jgi:hypothetical protein
MELNSEQAHVTQLNMVETIHTGHRGRPRKLISEPFLRAALSNESKISVVELAKVLRVSRKTVYRYMVHFGISRSYSGLTDGQIDIMLAAYRVQRPTSGVRYIMGFIRRCGLRVQRHRVLSSLKRIDEFGQALRHYVVIKRRCYRVPRPNSLWHMDGHHKLIHWGFVIHGIIDGYCRTVWSLQHIASF